jgi:hypothetical protein
MSVEQSEPNLPHRYRGPFIRVVAIFVSAVIALFVLGASFTPRVEGEIAAEQLAAEYVVTPCEARALYDGKTWTIVGTAVPVPRSIIWTDPNRSFFYLDGGTHKSDHSGCSKTSSMFHPFGYEGIHTLTLDLEWNREDARTVEIGDIVRVTCRIKLKGFGLNDHEGIRGTDCVPV